MRPALLAAFAIAASGCHTVDDSLPGAGKCVPQTPSSPLACALAPARGLPEPRNAARMLAARGHLYVLGGQTAGSNHFTPRVLVGTLGATGEIVSWTDGPPLPHELSSFGAVATDDALLLFGGRNSEDWSDVADVWRSAVAADGTPGAWEALAPLPRALSQAAAALVGSHVYVLGGASEATGAIEGHEGNDWLTTVFVGDLEADGRIAAWRETRPLPEGRYLHEAFSANGVLYVLGGRTQAGFPTCAPHQVLSARPDATGEVLAWRTATAFPDPMNGFGLAVSAGHVFLAGGISPGSVEREDVLAAELRDDGGIGPWTVAGTLPGHRYGVAAAAVGDDLYVAGGLVDAREKRAEVVRARAGTGGRLDCSP